MRHPKRIAFQSLENRQLMAGDLAAATMELNRGTLTVEGTGLADEISVDFVSGSTSQVKVTIETAGATRSQVFNRPSRLVVKGEGGDDYVINNTNIPDILQGGDGDDRLLGGSGDSTILGAAGVDLLYGRDGNDVLHGGAGDDLLRGGNGYDALYGNSGNDRLFGDAGSDWLEAGAGDDRLYGGAGNDDLIGGDGRDSLYGEGGSDALFGGYDGCADHLDGGGDSDWLAVENQVTWIYRNYWESFDRVYATDVLDSFTSDGQDKIEVGPWAYGEPFFNA